MLLTPNACKSAGFTAVAYCAKCRYGAELDLPAFAVAGTGGHTLADILPRLRCKRNGCGGKADCISVACQKQGKVETVATIRRQVDVVGVLDSDTGEVRRTRPDSDGQ